MKKLIPVLIVMSLLSVSCNKSGGSSSGGSSTPNTQPATADTGNTPPVVVPPTTTPPVVTVPPASSTVPALALSFQTAVDLMNFNATQAEKYNKAVVLVKKVVATEKFRNAILNYTWNGAKTFANNAGKTNAQIYQSILDAAESLHPAKNNTMDLGVKLYTEASNIIGYTNGSISYINVNTKYFNTFAVNDVGGNLFHEWLHKLGYVHDFAATAQRPYSVPYAVGYLVRDIGKSFL